MSEKSNLIKIPLVDLEGPGEIVAGDMKSISFKTTMNMSPGGSDPVSAVASTFRAREQTLSYLNVATNVGNTGLLMAEGINKVSLIIHRAFSLGIRVSQLYDEASNRDVLNQDMGASSDRTAEADDKLLTSSAVLAYTTAFYVVHELINYRESELESIQIEPMELPAFLGRPSSTRRALMFYYVANLEKSGKVKNENDFIKMTIVFFQSIMDAIEKRIDALSYTEIFTNVSYQLEGSEFSTSGFEQILPGHVTHVEFNRVDWGEIVGNAESKHSARRSIMGLMCYDVATKQNPMKDLGGFSRTKLTYGPPGTGKSMEIAAISTELYDRCKDLNIPYLFHPFPDNIVSTYQGGSAERAIAWFHPILHDPKRIIFAPIDDAENNLQNRVAQGVSAGVKEIVGVFLRSMEGAYAVDYGNNLVNMYTNNEEMLDPAVLSRVQSRTFMGGAETFEDFMDQDHLGIIKHFSEVSPDFLDLKNPESYKYMSAQVLSDKIGDAYAAKSISNVDKVADAIERTAKKYGRNTPEFFAYLDVEIKKEYPSYTSRDKRNIQSAVKTRAMDFDLPSEWLNDHDLFFTKDYDTKKFMILEAQKSFLKGMKLSDIFFQETVFYFDNLAKIADKVFQRKVQAGIEEYKIRLAVAEATSLSVT